MHILSQVLLETWVKVETNKTLKGFCFADGAYFAGGIDVYEYTFTSCNIMQYILLQLLHIMSGYEKLQYTFF